MYVTTFTTFILMLATIVSSLTSTEPRATTWSYTTLWTPYYTYWPIIYELRNPFGSSSSYSYSSIIEPAQNRLFPSHVKKEGSGGVAASTSASYRSERPEHRALDLPDEELIIETLVPVKEKKQLSLPHRFFSYMSSSSSSSSPPSNYSTTVKGATRLRRRSTAQLPISSTKVVFPSSSPSSSSSSSAPLEPKATNTSSSKSKGKRPPKTEGKLVLEGLSFLGSLLKPNSAGHRPLFSATSSFLNRPLFGSGLGGLGGLGGHGGLHNPLFASSASIHHPFFASMPGSAGAASPITSQSSTFHQFSPPPMSPIHLPGFAYPGPSALYPESIYSHYPLHSTNPYYNPSMPSPYQALSVDNLLVPLVGMVGLNLLRPDIIRSRREGGLSDIDGIDVFRHISQDEECLRRLACEVGVTVADDDDKPTIQRALERALTARRFVPSHHVPSNKNRPQCGRHSCELWHADATDETSDETPISDEDTKTA